MKKRLSKVARDLNSNISSVVEFLSLHGHHCEEDPNEELSVELWDFLQYNFQSYIADKQRLNLQQKPSGGEIIPITKDPNQIPLELKIIEAASREKRLIDRIIGFTDYDWHYTIIKYKGECSQPVPFSLFDEVICEVLLAENMSMGKLGQVLGLDITKDPAEKEILATALEELRKDNMIDGDDSLLWLTDVGKEYAENGVKYSTFTRNFDLYIDSTCGLKKDIKEIFINLRSEKVFLNPEVIVSELEEIKSLAEIQAPEIHYPEKNFHLQSASLVKAEAHKAKIWIVLFENFRDNNLRAIVYDEKQDLVIEILSEAIDKKEDLKLSLLNELIKISDGEEFSVEYTEEEKKEDQVLDEKLLIKTQEEIDLALELQDTIKLKEIEKQIKTTKRHFNSLEFEVELKRLFDETDRKSVV